MFVCLGGVVLSGVDCVDITVIERGFAGYLYARTTYCLVLQLSSRSILVVVFMAF
jgi:hypothetical protein